MPIVTRIATLPDAPITGDVAFDQKADLFLPALTALSGQLNDMIDEINTSVDAIASVAVAAESATTNAATAVASAATATSKATSATASATTATTKAAEAAASAVAAAANVDPLWLSHGVSPIGIEPSFQFRPGREDVPNIMSVVRPSTGTRTNEMGLIESVANNIMRIDYDPVTGECLGALVEDGRTNLITRSDEVFGGTLNSIYKVSLIKNSSMAPDGTITASKIIEDTAAASTHILAGSLVVAANTAHTMSLFVKSGERSKLSLQLYSAAWASSITIVFDFLTGIATTGVAGSSTLSTSQVTYYGNGWYRISISGILDASSTTANISIAMYDATKTTTTYTGDGVSGLYIWGAQLEAGAFATSYIPSVQTFTSRASTATYVGSDGLIKSAAINEARLDYTPNQLNIAPKMLLENASTNLLTYSEDFTPWGKGRATISANAIASPDGTVTADKLVEDTTASNTHFVSPANTSVTAGNTYTLSVYAKSGTRTQVALSFSGNLAAQAYFDLNSGSVIYGIGQIVAVGGGWYRCSITAIASGTGSAASYMVLSSNTTTTYTGDGVSGLYIWGAQLEVGSMTSYIPTTNGAITRAADVSTSAAATRSADVITVPVSEFHFNPLEGTLYADYTRSVVSAPLTSLYAATISNGTWQNAFTIANNYGGSLDMCGVFKDGSQQFNGFIGSATTGLTKKALAWALNSANCVKNGTLSGSDDTSVILPKVTTLNIGNLGNNSEFLNGHIRHIAYFPKRTTNSNLQLLTA